MRCRFETQDCSEANTDDCYWCDGAQSWQAKACPVLSYPGEHRTGTTHMNEKLSRAVQLLETLIRDRALTEEDLARELVIRPETLASYRSGEVLMPPERQLCLALLMTQLPGKHARMGHALLGQVRAATHYERRMNGESDAPTLRAS